MIRIRQEHWAVALLLALAVHAAIYFYSFSQPGMTPTFRGGGTFSPGEDMPESSSGVFVQLGKSSESAGDVLTKATPEEVAPPIEARSVLEQGAVAGDEAPGADGDSSEPAPQAEPSSTAPAEQNVDPKADDAGPAPEETKEAEPSDVATKAPPAPRRKPSPPRVAPEMEAMGRRLPVQGPQTATTKQPTQPKQAAPQSQQATPQAQQATPQAQQAAPQAQQAAPQAQSPPGSAAQSAFNFASGGRVGTAGGNTDGEIPELNYEDRVLLWIKKHGGYPYEAAMYRLEDVVTLHFAIDRSGRILYYELVKKSRYHLLNKAVERMMDRSSPVPPIPPEIGKDKITFTVPVRFTLEAPS